jgi:hypothetical protein
MKFWILRIQLWNEIVFKKHSLATKSLQIVQIFIGITKKPPSNVKSRDTVSWENSLLLVIYFKIISNVQSYKEFLT